MIYFLREGHTDNVKIGYTFGDPTRRIGELLTGQPDDLRLIGVADGDEFAERSWHFRFAASRGRREWFQLTPALARAIALANPDLREFFAFHPAALDAAGRWAISPPVPGRCPWLDAKATLFAHLADGCRRLCLASEPAPADAVTTLVVETVERAVRRLGPPCDLPDCGCWHEPD